SAASTAVCAVSSVRYGRVAPPASGVPLVCAAAVAAPLLPMAASPIPAPDPPIIACRRENVVRAVIVMLLIHREKTHAENGRCSGTARRVPAPLVRSPRILRQDQ